MHESLSNLKENLSEEIKKNKWKDRRDKCLECMEKYFKTKYEGCKCCLIYVEIKDKILTSIN